MIIVNKLSLGRNDPCFCGSGKKFKKCCLGSSGRFTDGVSDQAFHLKKAHQYMVNLELVNAENAFNDALKFNNNSVEALVGLGQCLCQQWRDNEGISVLLRAAKSLVRNAKKTKDVRQLLDLAFLLIDFQRPKEALPLVAEALAVAPDFPRAHHTKALALQKINTKQAYCSAKQAVELAPDESNAVILLASLEAKQGDLQTAKQRLQKLISRDVGIDKSRAYLELGVVFDKLGEYDQAFTCFSEAGNLNLKKPDVQRLDDKAVYHELQQSRLAFDAEYLKNCPCRVNDNLPAPVFLVGFYRSGTTLMEQILGAHPGVVTSDEVYIIPSVANEITKISTTKGPIQEKIKSLTSEQITYLRQFYWQTAERMIQEKLPGKVFVDKTAMNTLNLGLINTLFPNATLLFAVRDPRDVCLSCYMQSFGLSPLTVHFLDWLQSAKFYSLVMDYWLSVRDDLTLTWMELRYEDVLNGMESQFKPVFEKIGLEWSLECEQFYKHAQQKTVKTPSFDQVTQPLYHSSVQRWRHYEKQVAELERHLNNFVQHYGYKVDE